MVLSSHSTRVSPIASDNFVDRRKEEPIQNFSQYNFHSDDSHDIVPDRKSTEITFTKYSPQSFSPSPLKNNNLDGSPLSTKESANRNLFIDEEYQEKNKIHTPSQIHYISPNHKSQASSSDKSEASSAGQSKDIVWLLWALRPDRIAGRSESMEALREVRRLVKSATDDYWHMYCAQIITVLLEAFNPPRDGGRSFTKSITGLTPPPRITRESAISDSNYGEEENVHANSRAHISVASYELNPEIGESDKYMTTRMEGMHYACKILLILLEHRGSHVKVNGLCIYVVQPFLHFYVFYAAFSGIACVSHVWCGIVRSHCCHSSL
jgi:hypothetical protein